MASDEARVEAPKPGSAPGTPPEREAAKPPLREPYGSRRRLPGRPRHVFSTLLALLLLLVLAAALSVASGRIEHDALQLRFSEPYRIARALAERDDQVTRYLGGLSGVGWLPRGELSASESSGWCELELPLEGKASEGVLEARLIRRGGTWFWEWANLRLEDGTLIVLAVP